MEKVTLLNIHFPVHGNWQGLGMGEIVVVWLAYILSEGDHRLNSVVKKRRRFISVRA